MADTDDSSSQSLSSPNPRLVNAKGCPLQCEWLAVHAAVLPFLPIAAHIGWNLDFHPGQYIGWDSSAFDHDVKGGTYLEGGEVGWPP